MLDLQEVSGVLVLGLDASGRIRAWNRACAEVTGWTLEEVRGRSLSDLAPPGSLPGLEGFARPAPHRFDAPLPTRQGPVRWFTWATTPRPLPENRGVETVAVGLELTGQKREEERPRGRAPREHLEATVRQSEEQLRAIFEEASDGIALADADGRYVVANAKACEMLGRTCEELLSMTIADLVVPEELARLSETTASMLAGQTHVGEWRIRRGDGTEAIVEVSARMLSDKRLLAFVREVSERKRLQEERERLLARMDAERRWLQAVIDTVPLGVLLFEPSGRLGFNRRAEELFGMTLSPTAGSEQYRGRILFPDGTAVPPEQLPSHRILFKGETLMGVEFLIEQDSGERIPILGSAAPIRDADGDVIGGVGVFQDVSERMQAAAAIRTNERLLNGIFELLPVGVWIADHTGRIVRTNPAGLRIWAGARYVGVSEFGEYKAWWADTGKPIAADEWALARALNKGETSLGELLRIQCFDGSFKTIINSALPLYDEQGKFAGAIVVNEDVTGLREIEEALRRAVRARDEMLGVVSHDLRSPLQGIELAARRIAIRAAQQGGTEWLHPSLDRILRASRTMRKLIEDLLDIASIEEGRLSIQRGQVVPAALVHEVAESLQSQAEEKQLLLEVGVEPGLPPLSADPDRLLQVLSNLAGNALKFTPSGGRVSVRVTRRGDDVVFSVQDTGAGIPEEQQAQIFDRFWQADSADRRGRGLGLAIAKGLVQAHEGRIWVESTVGQGSTFSFSVPIAPEYR
ncbi:PAS domain S-box protein [Myxococcus sp. RHSTA-1-4]|uniref:PAS domain-containing sensor histidine kinase n=1 Tax=Myxococcus sp. RHSTA-1-4 TaxID=2874601 RepID=UPI001CBD07CC|nr:PAS domain S-box protein [Myxococcus sp. RHSTA-1-4]MBZ4418475.1 PAS domain S-box protein [Myxococcus sp. RHSTA-1-4]